MNRMEEDDYEQQQNLSDDDNAAAAEEEADGAASEDPLLLALDDLEGRLVSGLDQFRLHTGRRSGEKDSIHDELGTLLQQVLEVAAHTGPSVARTYFRGSTSDGLDEAVESAYERLVSDLVLPVLLEVAQSDTIAAKRAATLQFFRNFYKESLKAGSWADQTTLSGAAGPYGAGGSSSAAPLPRAVITRRAEKRLARLGEILRYWMQAAIACLTPGVFTAADAAAATASRGILAASAALRPALKHIVQRIKNADDRGASRLYSPVMKMVEGVLQQIWFTQQQEDPPAENLLAAAIKFLETVLLCCSHKAPELASSSSRRGKHAALQSNEDFSLGDLPEGHPVITREALESVADYAFSTLRGLVLMGGQVKMDATLLADRTKGSPSEKVVSLLKPAALAFLEWESTVDASVVVTDLDYSRFGFDFALGPKSYAISINAMSALALHRPAFFREAALCLARRTVKPPTAEGGSSLPEAGRKVVMAQLRASCLTLLRNVLSVSTNSVEVLQTALKHADMEVQADKALAMAKQAHKLRTATRSERNRANISYEWDTSGDQRQSKRLRETDDALAEMRAAKAAQGLGNGIQLPTNVTEAVELVLANLAHLPSSRPTSSAKPRKIPITLDFVVDAILTNGASLMQEDGRWYDRDGGIAWEVDVSEGRFQPSTKFLETIEAVPDDAENRDESEHAAKRQKLFFSQCQAAASDAMGRIIGQTFSRSKKLAEFSNQIGARLAFVLKNSQAPESLKPVHVLAEESSTLISKKIEPEIAEQARSFVSEYPLAASALALEAAPMEQAQLTDTNISLISCLLNEALLCCDKEELEEHVLYDSGLHIFVSSAVMASMKANEKPSDTQRKKAATRVTAALQRLLVKLPRLTKSSLVLLTSLCDLEDISKKAAELSRKTSSENVQAAAAAHAAKVAAEKRATAVLLILRDIAFQKDDQSTRLAAVECAVGVASGRYPSVASVQDKALKLVMNVMYPKNDTLAQNVIDAANLDLEVAKDYAVNSFDDVAKANDEAAAKADKPARSPLAPASDVEKGIMDKLRKPVILYMALAVRQTEIIETLFRKCSEPKAEVLSKTVQASMSKLARAAAAKHGAASVALSVAAMARSNSDLLLCFLENISPSNPDEDLIEVCLNLADDGGKKDVRFVTVVAPFLKKSLLIQEHLPAFVQADDKVFLRGLARMNDRVARQALLFRDEPDEDSPSLLGLTLVEQIVALHELDFAAVGIPQKRYLGVLKLCLGETDVYNDRVMMSALDQISGKFVAGEREKLPLAFMRSCILLLSLHSSLHSWIAQNLLPRLVDGKIYEDARQWEGWMRCAHMLEKSEDQGVRIDEAISKLPADQLMQYQTKWAGK